MNVDIRSSDDMGQLMAWRAEVLREVFDSEPSAQLLDANRRYYLRHVPDGTHVALIATLDDEPCGCGAVCFTEEMPSPDNPSGRCAYLMNIYVREPMRRRGIAHQIVTRLVEEARRRGCGKIYLESTPLGRPVYHELGFAEMTDMMKLKNPY